MGTGERLEISNDRLSRRTLLKGAVGVGVLGRLAGVGRANERNRHDQQGDSSSPDRYIVGTTAPDTADGEANASSLDVVATTKARARSIDRVLDFGPIGKAVVGEFAKPDRDALERDDRVRYVERDGTYEGSNQSLPWGIDRIDADETMAAGDTGSGSHIAVLDSGIDGNHPDLEGNLGAGKSFVDYTTSWDDDVGHGTHCAGIAGAIDNSIGVVGVASGTTLHAGKVLDADNSGHWSWLAAGLRWATNRGYDVASMSIGGPKYSRTLVDACEYAYNEGVLLVASAGNDYLGPVTYPASYGTVVAASSTARNDKISYFSNIGSEIELAAPGSAIRSTVPGGYGYKSGTSMACPHVSGVGALLMSPGGENLSNTQARRRLQNAAEDIGLSEEYQGYGLVDAEAAVVRGKNTLTIRGTGSRAEYTFSVTKNLEKSTANGANVNGNDEIRRDYVASGVVGTGSDSYTFDGVLETIETSGVVDVSLNGNELTDRTIEALPNGVLEIEGTGPRTEYTAAATGTERLQKLTANGANINRNDRVFRTTASGVVGAARDTYGFDGSLDVLGVDGDANMFVNGLPENPAHHRSHVVTIVGTGNRATYRFTVGGHLKKSTANFANRNRNDAVSGNAANGVVGSASDSFVYNGDISAFVADGNVVVYIDGERIHAPSRR